MNIEWEKKISVSNKILDEHHLKLFSLFEKLKNERSSIDEHILKQVLMEIKDYTYYHFNYEERLMKMANYPDLLDHKNLHINFMRHIDEIMILAKSEDFSLILEETYRTLFNWLNEHIMKVDKKYIDYLKDDN